MTSLVLNSWAQVYLFSLNLFQDTNAVNNMMSNMYRYSAQIYGNKRPVGDIQEPPSKQQCIEEKKFVEKIMYPSPDVLKKLKKDTTVTKQTDETGESVFTTVTTATYYIDKTGTTTSSNTTTTTTVTSVTAATKDSRETNIQKFLGNLPSRVATKPAPPAKPEAPTKPLPPTVPIPQVIFEDLARHSSGASPSSEQRRSARQRHMDKMRYHHAVGGNSRDPLAVSSQKSFLLTLDKHGIILGPVVQNLTMLLANVRL